MNEDKKQQLRRWLHRFRWRRLQAVGFTLYLERDCMVFDVYAFKGGLHVHLGPVAIDVEC